MALPKLDAPRYEMKLPSTNKKVVYRPYLVKEEKILMLAMESQDDRQMIRAIKDVITACTDGAVDVDQMTMFDMEYMFTQMRAKAVGEKTTVGVKCTSCETKNDVDIDLSGVNVTVPNAKTRKLELTKNIGVMLKYPSIDDILNAQASDNSSEVDKTFDVIIACIDSIYSSDEIFDAKDQTKKELSDFIESLSADQFSKIKSFVEGMPSAKVAVAFDCTKCGTHNAFDVKGIANFFG
jgi:DNA-directed RNA polymerase subunit M/transcription elongation factor TFIIS